MNGRLVGKHCGIVFSFLRSNEETKARMRRASLLVTVRDLLTVGSESSQLQCMDHQVHRTQDQDYVNRTKK